jgi:hypothetical protein
VRYRPSLLGAIVARDDVDQAPDLIPHLQPDVIIDREVDAGPAALRRGLGGTGSLPTETALRRMRRTDRKVAAV